MARMCSCRVIFATFLLFRATEGNLPERGDINDLPAQRRQKVPIVDGYRAGLGDIPYQVELSAKNKFCGGAIIHPDWVLTAAHCVFSVNWKQDMNVYYHLTDRYDPRRSNFSRRVVDVITHENKDYDIALVKLNESISFSKTERILPANLARHKKYAGRQAIFSGWGTQSFQPRTIPRFLHFVRMRILSRKVCSKYFESNKGSRAFICARTLQRDARVCAGDSGGPLILKDTSDLVGIMSFGRLSCRDSRPVMFVNVPYFREWIHNKIAPD